jgi:predicted glycosyltransferase
MARTLRIVCYAVNGGGLGHVTRLAALSRWMRRYAAHAGARAEIVFLTSSEAEGLLFREGLASFKVPSKTAAAEAGLDKLAHLALAKQWIWHSVALLRPDLFVVDTFPRGSFGELPGCLDLCRKKAFVYRPVKREIAERADCQAMLPLYDLVLVPEDAADLPVPAAVRPRVSAIGAVAIRERVELPSRAEARRTLAIPDGALAVLATAGGGGDPGAASDLDAVVAALGDDPSVYLVIAAGPLYRGAPRFGDRVRFTTSSGAAELLPAVDLAIAGAGYNTIAELAAAGLPAVLVPQDKVADEQIVRAARVAAAGAAIVLERPLSAEGVASTVRALREPSTLARLAGAARALPPPLGARRGAAQLLRLVLPASAIDAAVAAVGDRLLAASRALAVPEATFLEAIELLDPAPDELPGLDPAGASGEAVRLLEALGERGLPVPAALRALSPFLRRLEGGSPAERASAARAVARALAPFDDRAGAAALLKLAPWDTRAAPDALAAEVASLAAELASRGEDLYRGIARLVRAPQRPRARAAPAPDGELEPVDPGEGAA